MKKQAIQVFLLLFSLAAVSLGLTAITFTPPETAETFTVTAATYPMYTAALQVAGDIEGVSVQCLTAPTAGCTHDYQLSPAEMAVLSKTDLLVLSGGGAESFLQTALASLPSLSTVDTSAGIELLCVGEHHEHEHDHDHGESNEHLWVSAARYARQVTNLCNELCRRDSARAEIYTKNAARYLSEIHAIELALTALTLPTDKAVLFHDSVAYAADELGLTVLATLPIGEDDGVSVGDLTAAADAVRGQRVLLLFDGQYPADPLSLDTYADTVYTVVWDTAVLPRDGVADKDVWLDAMQRNIDAIKEAAA